jgi:hypothetical protein
MEVCDLAVCGGNPSRVENVARPTLAGLVIGSEYVKLKSLAAEAGDNLVAAISVEIPDGKRMAVDHRILDYMACPIRPFFGVHSNLIAVPGLNGCDKTALAEMADLHLAGAALRARA